MDIFAIIMACVLGSNYALQQFLGIDSVLSDATCTKKSLGLGASVTVVMVLSAMLTWVLKGLLVGLESLQLLVLVLAVLAVSAVVGIVVKAICKKGLGNGFAIIALNAAVLGGCLQTAESFGETVLTAAAAGIGFMVALLLYGELRARVDDSAAPKAFRGLPVSLLTAGMICLALTALK